MMTQPPDRPLVLGRQQIAAFADAASAAIDLPIPDACREGVIANLALIFQQSAALMALPLDATDEAAPVFRL
jgi:hypothetical protein